MQINKVTAIEGYLVKVMERLDALKKDLKVEADQEKIALIKSKILAIKIELNGFY